MTRYKYELEELEENVAVKLPYTYARRAQSCVKRDEWRQRALSDNKELLQEYAEKSGMKHYRISDRNTGEELERK